MTRDEKRQLNRALTRRIALVIAVFIATLVPLYVVDSIRGAMAWDPVGIGDDSGSPPCSATDLSTPNGKGEVAVLREVNCSGDALNFDHAYYIYVHKVGGVNDGNSLAFRFSPWGADQLSKGLLPKITWGGNALLRIAVGDGIIDQVTKMRTHVDGIDIVYAIGRTEHPPAIDWRQRPFGPAAM